MQGAVTAAALALALFAGCGGDDEGDGAGAPEPRVSGVGEAPLAGDRPSSGIVEVLGSKPGEPVTGTSSTEALQGAARADEESLREARKACPDSTAKPSRRNLRRLGAATLCLVNAERTARELEPLQRNRQLERAALGHSRDMVRRRYFAHESPRGSTPTQRIRRAGYIRGSDFAVGENIAFGSGSFGTPVSIVERWMSSPPHRANILSTDYRDAGIGVAAGAPRRGVRGGGTYTNTFGVLR